MDRWMDAMDTSDPSKSQNTGTFTYMERFCVVSDTTHTPLPCIAWLWLCLAWP